VFSAFPGAEFGLVITTGLYYRNSFFRSVFRLIRDSSLLFCAARAFDMAHHFLSGRSLRKFAKRAEIYHFSTADINDVKTLERVRQFKPDLLLSLYTMHIYRKEILGVPPLGGIGTHPSNLPEYRGLEVFFWAMVNQEPEIGVCVFTVKTKVDSGAVINEARLPLSPTQSMSSVYRMVTEKAADLLIKSMSDINNGTVKYRVPQGDGTYYPMPTRAAVKKFRKLGKRFF
jgi:methionyl-tRNA formyltransferase